MCWFYLGIIIDTTKLFNCMQYIGGLLYKAFGTPVTCTSLLVGKLWVAGPSYGRVTESLGVLGLNTQNVSTRLSLWLMTCTPQADLWRWDWQKIQFSLFYAICSLNWKRNTAFLLYNQLTNCGNENASVTWSILGINFYDAIFSNTLVLFACWSFFL